MMQTHTGENGKHVAPEAELSLEHVLERVRALLITQLLFRAEDEAGTRSPAAFRAWAEGNGQASQLLALAAAHDAALRALPDCRVERLCLLFALSPLERDLVQLCLALELEPGLSELCARLSRHETRGHASDALAAQVFGHGLRGLWDPSGSLARWEIVHELEAAPGEPRALVLDAHIRALLLGVRSLDPVLLTAASEPARAAPLAFWPVDATAVRVRDVLTQGARVRLLVQGREGSGCRTFAACVARTLGVSLLALDADAVSEADFPRFFMRAQRQAVLEGVSLLWHGQRAERSPARGVPQIPLQIVCLPEGAEPVPSASCVDVQARVPEPSLEQRRELITRFLPVSQGFSAQELDQLTRRMRLGIGHVVALSAHGVRSGAEACELARALTRPRLGELGSLLPTPYSWEDLVLPESVREGLRDLCFEAEERSSLWEQASVRRLFTRGAGLVGLFIGPPGTGKTMAAQVIAKELGLDLLRIDLASVVSKFIGETAKNLRRIFETAADTNAILLFDEADALFTRRTDVRDAHDRHANTDTNYLLQLVEDYRGLALLASNQRQHIDPAFIRRIRYVFELQRPQRGERQVLWTGLLRDVAGDARLAQLSRPVEALAATVDLSGAQIKQAVLSALFSARRDGAELGLSHLLRGVERELAKEGRTLTAGERERLVQHG